MVESEICYLNSNLQEATLSFETFSKKLPLLSTSSLTLQLVYPTQPIKSEQSLQFSQNEQNVESIVQPRETNINKSTKQYFQPISKVF